MQGRASKIFAAHKQGDERLDIAVGNHLDSGRDNAPWLTVWWNQPQSLAQNARRNRP